MKDVKVSSTGIAVAAAVLSGRNLLTLPPVTAAATISSSIARSA
jgi:hypothetical protein